MNKTIFFYCGIDDTTLLDIPFLIYIKLQLPLNQEGKYHWTVNCTGALGQQSTILREATL